MTAPTTAAQTEAREKLADIINDIVCVSCFGASYKAADATLTAGFTLPAPGEQAAAAARAQRDQGVEGWKLVPIEPTKAMHEAGEFAPSGIGGSPPTVGSIYRAMLAAAPSVSPEGGAQVKCEMTSEESRLLSQALIAGTEHLYDIDPPARMSEASAAPGPRVSEEIVRCARAAFEEHLWQAEHQDGLIADHVDYALRAALVTVWPTSTPGRSVLESDAFAVGDDVEKWTGDYAWRGVVSSVFKTPGGKTRYVVAHPVGRGHVLHIYGPQNLRSALQQASETTGATDDR